MHNTGAHDMHVSPVKIINGRLLVSGQPYCPTKQKGSNCSFGKALIITIFMTFKPTFVI